MRKLVVLLALSLSTTAAWAQAEKVTATKLPGEETLSTRERAERDFLMPIRRKKVEAPKPTASAEQLATAAPESDATAHYSEAAPDPRPEEVASPAHEAAPRSRAARHAAWLAKRRAEARREERAAEARRAARHTSKSSKSKAVSHSSKASRKSASAKHRTAEKSSHSKKAATHKTKKVVHHTATKKAKTKAKPATKHKRRR